MAYQHLQTKVTLPVSVREAWQFFSDPANLDKITPPEMNFIITSSPIRSGTYAGQVITYKVSPLLGIPMKWMTEITQVDEPNYFVDTQLYGPYKFWHHEHHFRETEGGVEMTDILYYSLPFGIIGDIINALVVRRQVENIFKYRSAKLQQLFPARPVKTLV